MGLGVKDNITTLEIKNNLLLATNSKWEYRLALGIILVETIHIAN
jgi:hypothetical protein